MSKLQNQPTFHVYNASAGSGKTYTIAREYLQIILGNSDPSTFQKILAITFTNKAANEMKERVLNHLELLSKGEKNGMILEIQQNLNIEFSVLQERAHQSLNKILENYAAFSISTIDRFTHKLIKSFAYDLKLPLNFEVELDATLVLNEAVESLINKIGEDKELTEFLIDFSIIKADEDKSWDISFDLNEIAKVVLNENDAPYVQELSKKPLNEYKDLYGNLHVRLRQSINDFKKVGASFLNLMEKEGLEIDDFFRKTVPNYFTDVANDSFKDATSFFDRSSKIRNAIETHTFYTKKVSPNVAQVIDNFVPQIDDHLEKSKAFYAERGLIELFLKSVNPIALISNIYNELQNVKEEKNIQLNSEFNTYIYESIKDQPAPFIYERLGQRYLYYFIDEMQDTSGLQWQNLIPLLKNALAQENSKLFVVGDAKQSIYRWRGGKAEQFIALGSPDQNFFQVPKEIHHLPKNYRSYSNIIEFNNQFFTHVANYFKNPAYKHLYIQENNQQTNDKLGGFVSLKFLELASKKEERFVQYSEEVFETLEKISAHYDFEEVCILVRKNDLGIAIANFLSDKNIEVISAETLLLQNSSKVNFLINMFLLFLNKKDNLVQFDVLYFLHDHLQIQEDKHEFLSRYIKQDSSNFNIAIETKNVHFAFDAYLGLSLYEMTEKLIREFKLETKSDAHLKFFLDLILERQKRGDSMDDFIDFWDLKKDKLSLAAVEKKNAVRIMTVHKSKGLEFPVVIFPTDENIHDIRRAKDWYNPSEIIENAPPFSISVSKKISDYGSQAAEIYERNLSESELDNINLLYVALTRPVEQLYIISGDNGIDAKNNVKTNHFSGLFIDFLQHNNQWKGIDHLYAFGQEDRMCRAATPHLGSKTQNEFVSVSWKSHQLELLNSSSKLWDTERGKAIEFGNLIHDMLAQVHSENDIESVIQRQIVAGYISKSEEALLKSRLQAVVTHPMLKEYFSSDYQSLNERELVDGLGQIIKPDKVAVKDKKAVIIDYKTGQPEAKHRVQIQNYGRVIQHLGYAVQQKLLVYINEEIQIDEVQ